MPTASRPLVIVRSVTTTRSSTGHATAGANPNPGTRARKACRPSARTCDGPSPSGGATVVTTSSRATEALLASTGPAGASESRTSPTIASSSSPIRRWAASASAWTQAIDEPGMMSWNCSVSTSRHSGSRSATDRPAVAQPQLGLAQQPLTAQVAALGPQLAGQRAAMRLEVQLAAPHRHRRAGGAPRRRRDRRTPPPCRARRAACRRGRPVGAGARASRASARRHHRRTRTAPATTRSRRARRTARRRRRAQPA